MKKQSAPAQSGPDAGPWVDLGNGRSRSASTGKMRYDPNADPAYRDAIKRIQAQEQAAAAKASSAANQRTLSIVDAVLGGRLGKAGCAIGSYTGGYVGASMDAPEQPKAIDDESCATVLANYGCSPIMPIQPDQAELTWGQPTRVWPPEQPAPDPGWFTDGVQVGAIYSYSMVSPAQKQCGFSMIKRVWVDGKLISEEIE